MSSKGDGRMESSCFGRQSKTAQPQLHREAVLWSNHAAVRFHSAAATPALTLSEFIRWEIIACNVIYLARNPSLSEYHPPIRQTS